MSNNIHILNYLQASFEELYALDSCPDVRDFLVGEEIRDEIPGHVKGLPEQFFVSQNDEGMELALFIEPDIIESLKRDDPRQSLHVGNLENFWIAAEGVSHFIFLIWRAQRGRPVSHLELELQAEVDKFVRGWTLLVEQGASMDESAAALNRVLFRRYALRDDLPDEQSDTYHRASKAAERFCLQLRRDFSRAHNLDAMMRRVRDFYRLGLSEKMRAA